MISLPEPLRTVGRFDGARVDALATFARDVVPLYERVHDRFPGGNDHGPRHIERVLGHYCQMFGTTASGGLTTTEFYIGAVALIAHDIGLLHGRPHHAEVGAEYWSLLRDHYGYVVERNEQLARLVGRAIAFHSSSRKLEQIPWEQKCGDETVKLRAVAAAVRLSDEVDEDARRAHPVLEKLLSLPEQSEIFWAFNKAIAGLGADGGCLVLHLAFPGPEALLRRFEVDGGDFVLFQAALSAKLSKLAGEAFYCGRSLPDRFRFSRVIVRMELGDALCPEISIASDWFDQQAPRSSEATAHYLQSHLSSVGPPPLPETPR